MKLILSCFLLLFVTTDVFAIEQASYQIAKDSLESNIVSINGKKFLSAGGNQFRSFWTRDFAFSSEALMKIGRDDVVKNQIEYLLNHLDQNYLVPLYIDSKSPVLRVVENTFCRFLGCRPNRKVEDNIRPYYLVNGNLRPIDSNLALLFAISQFTKTGKNNDWYKEQLPVIEKVFHYYDNLKIDGLIYQDEHADWQDSAKRVGATFFTNIIYYQVARDLQLLDLDQLVSLRKKIIANFYDSNSGLFFSIKGKQYISLDGILWALDNDVFNNSAEVYNQLKFSVLFKQYSGPGFATYPSYDSSELYLQVKMVGLNEYHGKLYWSWLLGKVAKVAKKFNDGENFNNADNLINKILLRDQTVYEIYDASNKHLPFETKLYKSESPFSWGAAAILEYN